VTEHVQMPQGPLRLETDLRLAFLLLNEARYRTLESVFGLSRDQANLATLVLLSSLAGSAGQRVHRMMSQPPPVPTRGDTVLGVSLMRELVQSIAGPASRDTSTFGTLVAVAAMGGVALPIVRRSIRAAESGLHEVSVAFRHRYGVHAARAAEGAAKAAEGAARAADKLGQTTLGRGDR
jgi:hypothetical protein